MDKIVYLENIQAEAPLDHILMRMGYKKGLTKIAPAEQAKIDVDIKKTRALCRLQGAYVIMKIPVIKPDLVELENGAVFKSSKLSDLLSKSKEAVLMASTAGKEAVGARDREVAAGNGSSALIIDATASETADAGLDWIQGFLNGQLARKGRKLTTRFSPGYGDLDLSAQKTIYDILALDKIGVGITDRFLLVPEKTVIAIAGVF
jgi:hypothetical protein